MEQVSVVPRLTAQPRSPKCSPASVKVQFVCFAAELVEKHYPSPTRGPEANRAQACVLWVQRMAARLTGRIS